MENINVDFIRVDKALRLHYSDGNSSFILDETCKIIPTNGVKFETLSEVDYNAAIASYRQNLVICNRLTRLRENLKTGKKKIHLSVK